jgi:hypothetical protein
VHGFNFDSYPPGDLDDVLAMPKPKSGMDIGGMRKVRFRATLVSYAKPKCSLAGLVKLTVTMLPTVFPPGFANTIAQGKCITVKSSKGAVTTVAIQDPVAEFLPKEVPLGAQIDLYCVVLGTTADDPLILVNEFQALDGGSKKQADSARPLIDRIDG